MQYAQGKYNKINYRQILIRRVKSSYSNREGGEVIMRVLYETDTTLRSEKKESRTNAAIEVYGEGLGRSLIEYVYKGGTEDTRKAFATEIAASLENGDTQQKTTAVMALMSAFELLMENKIEPVRRTATRASHAARPLFRRAAS